MATSENVITLELPLVLTADEGAQLAEVILQASHRERDSYEFSLPFKYVYLEPTDIITVALDGVTHVIRITEIDSGKPGILKCKGLAESAASYASTAVGEAGAASTNTLTISGPTNLQLLDIPILRDQDDDSGYYLAATGYFTGWPGSVVYKSFDEGQTFLSLMPILNEATAGTTTDALADGPTTVIDTVNTVNVSLNGTKTLSSITELAVLNDGNPAAIGADGRWELIKFQTATLEANGTYTLSNLIRGVRGTEHNTANHTSIDNFVFLNTGTTRRADADDSEIGVERNFKGVTFGSTLQGTEEIIFTNNALGLEPYSPVHITALRDGSNDLNVDWIWRTRLGGEWRDAVGPTQGEATLEFEIDFVDDSVSPEIVITKTGLSSVSYDYLIADQQTDFGSPIPVTLRVDIYQVSATVGRGTVGSIHE